MAANEQASSDASQDQGKPTKKMLVNVADLRRRLGEQRTLPIDVILPTAVVVQSRTTSEPVVGEVLIESIERGVTVTGSITFSWEADCRRCLSILERSQTVEIDEIFQIDAPDDTDMVNFDGQQIDLFPVIRDIVALSLPLAPLCEADCAGPDPDRYPAVVASDGVSGVKAADPRWAALDSLDLGEN